MGHIAVKEQRVTRPQLKLFVGVLVDDLTFEHVYELDTRMLEAERRQLLAKRSAASAQLEELLAGPELWMKFRKKYGEQSTLANFLYGSHSRPTDRIRNIRRELRLNYPDELN